MFDFAWSEIALIGIVALIAIGPKDLPVAIRAVTRMIKKARRLAGEFQTHVDDMMREADLQEVRTQINQIRNFDLRGEVTRTVDPDGSLRSTFAANPLAPSPPTSPPPRAIAPADGDQADVAAPGAPPSGIAAPATADTGITQTGITQTGITQTGITQTGTAGTAAQIGDPQSVASSVPPPPGLLAHADAADVAPRAAVPAFIPPGLLPPLVRAAPQPEPAPAFIPPQVVLQQRPRPPA